MDIGVRWLTPLELIEDRKGNLIYECPQSHKLPIKAGVYAFLRKFGQKYKPVYVGETSNLRSRIRQHLENNLRLMRAIENLDNGKRFVLAGVIQPKPGHQSRTVRRILQEALIRHCLSEGHQLLNKQGVNPRVHNIEFAGNRVSEGVFGREMLLPAE